MKKINEMNMTRGERGNSLKNSFKKLLTLIVIKFIMLNNIKSKMRLTPIKLTIIINLIDHSEQISQLKPRKTQSILKSPHSHFTII